MKLTRGEVVGYDSSRMSYRFTMMQDANVIECEISSVALKDLHGFKWEGSLVSMDTIFLARRDAIEDLASGLFEQCGPAGRGPVRIFAKHLSK
jgi:hypothetical protein